MPHQVTLRAANPADAKCIADVLLASRKAFLAYAPSPHTDAEIRAWVRDVLLPGEQVTVAVVTDQVVGISCVKRSDGVSWLTQMYLDPEHANQGIGTQLLAHALANHPRPFRLYTFQQNLGARRFYERHGFLPIAFTDGTDNEERCPDVLYELAG
jgi:GNAT superfamily N-acetyltransferase